MAKPKMTGLDWVAYVLVIVGGLNWGLAVFDFNLVTFMFGVGFITKIVYALVGLSAVYGIFRCAGKK